MRPLGGKDLGIEYPVFKQEKKKDCMLSGTINWGPTIVSANEFCQCFVCYSASKVSGRAQTKVEPNGL